MQNSPPAALRASKRLPEKTQCGVILSFTKVRHPPEGFPDSPREIGLIELDNGERVMGCLITGCRKSIEIGMRVVPRMRLARICKNGLRIYDIFYEIASQKPAHAFPGYVLALTGPSGVGKTTVSMLLSTRIKDYVERVPIVTTRKQKEGDGDEYEHLPEEEFLKLKNDGKLAAFTFIPDSEEKRWYGYRTMDIETIWQKGKIPVVIAEMHLLQGIASHFGRRSVLSFGLLPPGKSKRQKLSALLRRLRLRGRETEKQIKDRLKNAEADLQFFMDRKELFDHLIINDEIEKVVERLSGKVMEYARA